MSDAIVVRKLPPGLKQGLRERAASHGRSVEAEVRQILMDVVFPQNIVVQWLDATADLEPGPDLEIPARDLGRDPVVFDE